MDALVGKERLTVVVELLVAERAYDNTLLNRMGAPMTLRFTLGL